MTSLLKERLFLFDGEAQGQKDFPLRCHSAILAALDAIECQRRYACQACEFGLAQHLRFAHLLDVIFLIHAASPGWQDLEVRKLVNFVPKGHAKSTKIMLN